MSMLKSDIWQGLKSLFICQAARWPIFHSRLEQKKIVVAQHSPNIRQNPGGKMQKLLRDGSKKHSDPAKASFPVGGSMWALSRLHQTSLDSYLCHNFNGGLLIVPKTIWYDYIFWPNFVIGALMSKWSELLFWRGRWWKVSGERWCQ